MEWLYLLGVMKTFEVIVALSETLLGNVGAGVTLVKLLPEVEAASTA